MCPGVSIMVKRSRPNILITGTPGTGKTVTSARVAELTGLRHVNVGQLVEKEQCYEGRDEEFDAWILDEDKLLDAMEPIMADGGNVVDYHSCDFFPERFFDLVLVMRVDNTTLYDRLTARGYSARKRTENLDCEIMQVVLDEAKDSYAPEIVHELQSVTPEDLEANISRVQAWVAQWMADQKRREEAGGNSDEGEAMEEDDEED